MKTVVKYIKYIAMCNVQKAANCLKAAAIALFLFSAVAPNANALL
jgi:hypothetical protein